MMASCLDKLGLKPEVAIKTSDVGGGAGARVDSGPGLTDDQQKLVDAIKKLPYGARRALIDQADTHLHGIIKARDLVAFMQPDVEGDDEESETAPDNEGAEGEGDMPGSVNDGEVHVAEKDEPYKERGEA